MENNITKEEIIKRIGRVMDPELHIDIWSLGLIYDVALTGEDVKVVMTYTSPMCPLGPQIQADITQELTGLGCKGVEIEVTFDPPWQMPEELQSMMGVGQ